MSVAYGLLLPQATSQPVTFLFNSFQSNLFPAYLLTILADSWTFNHNTTDKTNWKDGDSLGDTDGLKKLTGISVVVVGKVYYPRLSPFLFPQQLDCCIALVNTPVKDIDMSSISTKGFGFHLGLLQ